jgi:hypothetical protein
MVPSDICVVLAAQSIRGDSRLRIGGDYSFYAQDLQPVLAQLGFEASIPQVAAWLRRACLLDSPPIKIVEKSPQGNSYEVTPAGQLWLRNEFPDLQRAFQPATPPVA